MAAFAGILKNITAFFSVLTMLISGALFPGERPQIPQSENVTVMSFNLLYSGIGERSCNYRTEAAVDVIESVMPDSFGVQEATPVWMFYLSQLLPEYDYVGVGRFNGAHLGEYSAVFYLKDKYEAVESDTFWISETPEKPSSDWDSSCNRICTWVLLRNKATGEEYAHINTHLDHKSDEANLKGAQMVSAKAAEFSVPCVITGDFNANEKTDTYAVMTENFIDSRTVSKSAAPKYSCTWHDMDIEARGGNLPIDFIFVSPKTTVHTYDAVTDIFGGMYSDHFAIYAELEF